jgi:hypothetical protein
MTATLPILRSVKPEQHGKLYLEMRLNGEGVGEGWVQHYSPNYSDGAGFTRLPVEIKLVHLSCNFKYSYRGREREREATTLSFLVTLVLPKPGGFSIKIHRPDKSYQTRQARGNVNFGSHVNLMS